MLQHTLEDKRIQQEAENEIKLAQMEQEKSNMDATMLRHEALLLAKRSYAGKYISETNLINLGQNDSANAVLGGLIKQYETTKRAVGH